MAVVAELEVNYGGTINYTKTLMGTITSAKLTDIRGNEMSLTSVTNSSASIPDIVDGTNVIQAGIATLSVSDGNITSTTLTTLIPALPLSYTTLVSPLDLSASSYLSVLTSPEEGDQVIYNSSELSLLAGGGWMATADGTYNISKIDINTGLVETASLNTQPAHMVDCLPWRLGTKGIRVCDRINSRKIQPNKVTGYVYK